MMFNDNIITLNMMSKKIIMTLAVLIFACSLVQAQNKDKKKEKNKKENIEYDSRDVNSDVLNYIPVRSGDTANRDKMLQDLIKQDVGAASVATVLSSYHPFVLPSIDDLFERAKNNPDVIYKKHEMDAVYRDIVNARRKWMQWISGNAAYSYGKYNTNLFYQQTNIPTADQYSEQATSYYLAGGSVSINLYDVFNMGNSIKQAKSHYQAAQYIYKADYERIIEQVNTSYNTIISDLPLLSHSIQWAKLSELALEDAKLNFINGRMDTDGLFKSMTQHYRAIQELSGLIKEINTEVKFLELVTNSRILPDDASVNLSNVKNKTVSPSVEYPANTVQVENKGRKAKKNRK